MIHSFTCKNFYSFADETTIKFIANENASEDNGYFVTESGTRLSKVETVIGPNASGKTNLMKVLPFLKWLIVNSFEDKPGELIPFKAFVFGRMKEEPTELSVKFEVNSKVYAYDFVLKQERIIFEELKRTEFIKKRKSTRRVFVRTWNEELGCYEFSGESLKNFENLFRENASVVSTASRLNHKESREILELWELLETNVAEAGWIGDRFMLNPAPDLLEALDFYSENKLLKKEAEKLIARFDLGLSGFHIKKEKTGNDIKIETHFVHLIDGEKYGLNLSYESSGTKQLFLLLRRILTVLDRGGIAVLDEFDVNFHPEIVIALFGLFVQPETNPRNAQLFFSTNSHLILNELDKYQVVLVEKDELGISQAWRLDEVANVRPDENYYTKYIAGAYGAVPRLQ